MANNLRKFNTYSDYESAELVKPAVSLITDTYEVYFDQKEAPVQTFSGLTVYYNITKTTSPTTLFKGGGGSGSGSGSGGVPSAMIIDGTAVEVTNTYQFSTTGEHIVNYSFADNVIPHGFLNIAVLYKIVTKVEIGDAMTNIGEHAFDFCSATTSVTIGSGVTNIGIYAFDGCRSLTSITIPDSVTNIGMGAFLDCSGLTSVTIGSGITSIAVEAFRYCESLTSITVNALQPPTLESYAFNDTNNCPIYVPSQSVDEYKDSTSTGWSAYASRIQALQ